MLLKSYGQKTMTHEDTVFLFVGEGRTFKGRKPHMCHMYTMFSTYTLVLKEFTFGTWTFRTSTEEGNLVKDRNKTIIYVSWVVLIFQLVLFTSRHPETSGCLVTMLFDYHISETYQIAHDLSQVHNGKQTLYGIYTVTFIYCGSTSRCVLSES